MSRTAGTVGRVVLVRPWTDARAGGGCCAGPVPSRPHEHDASSDPVGAAYRALRGELPDLDDDFARQVEKARADNKVLRYLVEIADGVVRQPNMHRE